MRGVLWLAVHELRVRWRGWVMFALLVAIGGGAVLASAAGARRTSTAYPRFLQVSHASDVEVTTAGPGVDGYYQALGRLPGVAAVAPVVGLNVQPIGHGSPSLRGTVTAAPFDGRLWRVLDRLKFLAGRLPLPDRPGEIAVDQAGAAILHLRVGSTLVMAAFTNGGPARPRLLRERVVGIAVTRGSVAPVTEQDKVPLVAVSTALWHQLGPAYEAFDGAFVRLSPGITLTSFSRRAQALSHRFPATQGQVYLIDEHTQAATVERLIRPEAIAFAVFTLVLAVTALLIIGQAAARLLLTGSAGNQTLAALGMTRRQLLAAGLTEVTVAGTAGAAAAVAMAIAASPLTPIGTARLAEPAPGVAIDVPVLATGAAGIVVLLVACSAWPAWRLASARAAGLREQAAAGPPARTAAGLVGAWAPVTAATGVRLALAPGRGRTSVPVRGALAGATLSVLAVTAAFTFGANLLHLVQAPSLYGQRWDASIDLQFQPVTPGQTQRLIGRVAGVSGWTFGDHGTVSVGRTIIPAIGVRAGKGPLLSPTLLRGHPPGNNREIVLGTSTLRQIRRQVGDFVTVTVDGRPQRDRIVGQAVFPYFGQGGFTPTDLGQGAETTAAVLAPQAAAIGGGPGFQFVLLRFRPGSRLTADMAGLQRSMAAFCRGVQQSTCVLTDQRPNGITDYQSIDAVPQILAILLAVLGLAILGQLAILSGRRRRHDFAILKALGLLRRQVSAITAWQASTLTGLALLAGLPLGVAAGRWGWALFATGLGIPADPVTPVAVLLLMVPAVILAGNAVAFWPGRVAARLSPARVLRAE